MPLIQKPKETGIPVVDALYSAEPDISPVPLTPAIAREALTKAVKEALPTLTKVKGSMNNMYTRNLADTIVNMLPKKHIAPVKEVHVVPPEMVVAMSPEARSKGIITGLYLPDYRAILLTKGHVTPSTVAHEVGHDVLYYADPRYMQRLMDFYFNADPKLIQKLTQLSGTSLHNPSEVFAEAYAQSLLRQLGDQTAARFFYALPPEVRNMPYQIKPYRGILD